MARVRSPDGSPPGTDRARAWPTTFADLARDVLAARVDALRPYLERDASQLDAAEIHRLRSSLRRLRSSLWLLRPLGDKRLAVIEQRARNAVRALGAVRDIDEHLRSMAPRGALKALLQQRRRCALETACRSLSRNGASRWPGALGATAQDRAAWATPLGRAAARPVVAGRVRQRHRRLKRHLKGLGRHAELGQFHAARRRAKQFADALDDVAPYLGPVATPLRRSVQVLRSALGRLQDAAVTRTDLEDFARQFADDRSMQRRLRRLSVENEAGFHRALRRAARAARGMPPAHWRRVRDALGPASCPAGKS